MMTASDWFGKAEIHEKSPQIVKADIGVRSALENPQKDRLAHSTIMPGLLSVAKMPSSTAPSRSRLGKWLSRRTPIPSRARQQAVFRILRRNLAIAGI